MLGVDPDTLGNADFEIPFAEPASSEIDQELELLAKKVSGTEKAEEAKRFLRYLLAEK